MMRWVILTACLFAAGPETKPAERRVIKADAGPVRVTIDAPPSLVGLADALEYSITMLAPQNVEVRWPRHLPGKSPADAKVLGSRNLGPDQVDRFLVRRWFLRFEPLKLGEFNPGQVVLEARIGIEPWTSQTLDLPTVQIVKGPTSSADISTQRPVPDLPIPRELKDVRSIYFLTGAIVFIATLVAWGWLRRRERVSARTPAQHAFLAIDLLLQSDAATLDDRAFVDRLNGIARGFLEAAYLLPAGKRSTPEILADLQAERRLSDAQQSQLERFLESTDVERFQAALPGETARAAALRLLRAFLQGDPGDLKSK